jgi:hypothetical protein
MVHPIAAAEYTPRERAALSWAALVKASAPWRDLNVPRLSFTDPGWGPAEQLYGSIAACFAAIRIAPGCAAGLGFAALTGADGTVDEEDAAALLEGWRALLPQPPAGTVRRPSLRKEPPQ